MAKLLQYCTSGSGLHVSRELKEIAKQQVKSLRATACALSVCGTNAIVLVMMDFRTRTTQTEFIIASCIVCLYLAWGVLVLLSRGQAWFLKVSTILLLVQGSLWGLMVYRLAEIADIQQTRFVITLIIGLVSTPILSSPFSVAVAFWFPVAVGGELAVARGLQDHDYYLASTILGYELLVLGGIIIINRTMLQLSVARLRLRNQNETVGLLLKDYEETAADWLWEVDEKLVLRGATTRFAQVLRCSIEDIEGRLLKDILKLELDDTAPENRAMIRALEDKTPFRDMTVRVHVAGEDRWLAFTGRVHENAEGLHAGFRGVGSDITVTRRAIEETRYLATHDGLTGVGNRRMFINALELACDPRPETQTGPFTLVMLDLDRFKEINDDHGHSAGDAVLMETARRLSVHTRPGEVIARLGGDEFALILSNTRTRDARIRAEQIIDHISQPSKLDGTWLSVGASAGLAHFPSDGATVAEIMRNADLALYRAKENGRGTCCIFDVSLAIEFQDRVTLLADLQHAVDHHQTQVFYQPIMHTESRRPLSMEALCRWTHPERGSIPPAMFISLAEESGLIHVLGRAILFEACGAASRWDDDTSVSVNISPVQLRDPMMANMVLDVLAETGLSPKRLELEITESTLLRADRQTTRHLLTLKQRGIRLVLDDFGTGFSSLSTIRNFDFDGLKIDAGFVRDLETDPKAESIIRMVATMASELGVTLTVEGIETEGQLSIARTLGIARVQGYLLGRPTLRPTAYVNPSAIANALTTCEEPVCQLLPVMNDVCNALVNT